MNKFKGELIPADSRESTMQRQSTTLARYGDNTLAGRIDQFPDSPYTGYLAALSSGSRSTAKSTLGKISQLLYSSEPEVAPWHLMTSNHYQITMRYLEQQGLAPKTIHRHMSMIRSVLKTAKLLRMIPDENQGEYDAIMASKNIKGSQGRGEIRPHRSLSDEEISCLFSMLGADQSPKGLRDMAMLSVMRGCGLRRMEVVGLQIEHIRWAGAIDGELLVYKGKGNKPRTLPMPRGLREIFGNWTEVRGDDLGPLFCSINRGGKAVRYTENDVIRKRIPTHMVGQLRPLDRSSVNRMMEQRLILAGIERATPHDLRYTFAQKNLKRSDIQTVSDLMGHSNISTTSIYTETSRDEMRAVIAEEDVFSRYSEGDDN